MSSRFLPLAALAAFSVVVTPSLAAPRDAATRIAAAPESAAEHQERLALASELLALSNVPQGIESWKKMLLTTANFDQCGCGGAKGMVAKLKDGWSKAVGEEFKTEDVVQTLAAATAEALTSAEMKSLIAVRKSRIGLKVNAAEHAAHVRANENDPAAAAKRMTAVVRKIEVNRVRKALLQKLSVEQGGARALADAFINISIGSALGASAAAPANRPTLSREEIVAQIEAMRPMMEKQFEPIMVPALASQYEPLSDGELKELLVLSRKPLERKWTAFSLASFNAAMRAQAIKIGARLAKEIEGEKI